MATKKNTGRSMKRGRSQKPSEKSPTGRQRVASMPAAGWLVKADNIDRHHARLLEELMADATEITVSTERGEAVTLSGALLSLVHDVASALKSGESVTVLGQGTDADPGETVISSQEAADLLNVSRPFVVKLARNGQLRHHMVGNRHRFSVADVVAYAEHMRAERSAALAAIAPAQGYTAEDF